MGRISVVIAEDHEDLREAEVLQINDTADLQCTGEVQDLSELAQLLSAHHPDVVLLDLELRGDSSLRHLASLRRLAPQTRFIVFTGHMHPQLRASALAAGAAAYIQKSGDFEDCLNTIREVMRS